MEPRSEMSGDKSRVSLVIVWFLFLAAVISVCARLGTKYGMARRLAADDALIIIAQVRFHLKFTSRYLSDFELAQVTSLAQCIAISFAATSGLGAAMDGLAPSQVDDVLKVRLSRVLRQTFSFFKQSADRHVPQAEYASTPFLLLTLALVKWSICVFINHLSPTAVHRHVDLAFRTTIGLWLASATVVSVFQCGLPRPWDYIDRNGCTDRVSITRTF